MCYSSLQANFFDEYQMEGVSSEDNEICLEVTPENLSRALKTVQNAKSVKVKLTKKHCPCLTVAAELVRHKRWPLKNCTGKNQSRLFQDSFHHHTLICCICTHSPDLYVLWRLSHSSSFSILIQIAPSAWKKFLRNHIFTVQVSCTSHLSSVHLTSLFRSRVK